MVKRFGWDPFSELKSLRKRMDRVFSGPKGEIEEVRKFGGKIFCDMVDREDKIIVTADLPGVEKEDIDMRCEKTV